MEKSQKKLLFSRKNYILLFIGLAISAIGFILMAGGGASDDTTFNPEIFNAQRITVAPIIILIGLIINAVAIMKNFDTETPSENEN
jgi:cell division protein FtsL